MLSDLRIQFVSSLFDNLVLSGSEVRSISWKVKLKSWYNDEALLNGNCAQKKINYILFIYLFIIIVKPFIYSTHTYMYNINFNSDRIDNKI